ncbi:hypothetical protein [Bosea sp. ANAM02]|uniref:hypothetical protein n=1 Tax=Bosea sp. ANAM02 TaxID=2020412 RepID=UPI00140F3261|nr:hypothetical protein [Bosea sp. ANAM02]BCB21870.1 hypothetical protein OCUBac02_47640 [Bosea sp. ANAM02]
MDQHLPNRERINDRAKLIMHRLVARELARDPALVNRARDYLRARAFQLPGRDTTLEREKLLSLPASVLRRKLTCRSEDMVRLRLSSPFMVVSSLGLDDIPLRRRIWRMARRMRDPGPPSSVYSGPLAGPG